MVGNFAERLKEVRLDNGLTQKRAAEICGVTSCLYSKWEQGTRQPYIDKIVLLCNALDVSSDYLLGISRTQDTERMIEKIRNIPKSTQKIVMEYIDIMQIRR